MRRNGTFLGLTPAFALCWLAVAAKCLAQDAAALVDYSQVDVKELGVALITPQKDPKTGFIVGGKNELAFERLTEINGRSIAELEAEMRPGATSDVGSDQGFLGKDESLLAVLAADNRYIVDKCQLTHQEIATHLRVLAAIGDKQKQREFIYHGARFRVSVTYSRGFQLSPFRDGTKANADVLVENLSNGKQLEYSLLVPLMIERYGFYEGQGTPYRVAPERVIALLDFLVKKPPTPAK